VALLAARVRRDAGEALSAVVHAAGGFGMSGPVAESDVASWDRMLAINLTTAYLTTRALLPLLRPARGAMVYFVSAAVLPGASGPRMSAYVAAKAGVLALMHAVAEEERAAGVRANALAPTAIRTAANLADMGENARYVTREEVARTVAWLCGEESRAVTGQVLGL
jgi:NAD(P)-dependent dehydrogenase (short-subunit alcohol dehydrogenase family)